MPTDGGNGRTSTLARTGIEGVRGTHPVGATVAVGDPVGQLVAP
jgi:hypothetical protein